MSELIPIEELRAGDIIRNVSGVERVVTDVRRDAGDYAVTTDAGVLFVHAETRVDRMRP